ncbi:hypothetical protein J5N97_019928 [Dioscorea zingiberensis]|uniref:Retrovirus-related Pol polyprotein from transposon TNT 1-94-like beta-barrel domain-containing protein n=1 Tax=Dioscorea zingiberensis TaxID=325984 RepID=A0A9D5CFL6_9LILI|nr:hypothetical protein J5N97_019928 [Dioscorea zingiberensis]
MAASSSSSGLTSCPLLSTTSDLSPNLIAINVAAQVPIKLTATNYCAWRAQFHSLLIEYDLYGYVDGSLPCPPSTITAPDSAPDSAASVPNPAYSLWICQDKLLLNALLGSLTANLVPFIASKKTSMEAWKTLEKTYASPSRGRIMELRRKLATPVRGSRTITEYMQDIQSCIDSLAFMDKPVNFDELSIRILNGLDDSYKHLSSAIQARETPITFEELFEKMLHEEAQQQFLPASPPAHPTTALATQTRGGSLPYMQGTSGSRSHHNRRSSNYNRPSQPLFSSSPSVPPSAPRPPSPVLTPGHGYQGKYQICGTTGHSARQCCLVPPHTWDHIPVPPSGPPRVNTATHYPAPGAPSDWVVDSGASHHVTTDLSNLSLHQPYTETETVVIGDGTCLPITHTGSMCLSTLHDSLSLTNVLHVPSMSLNLISVLALCATNAVTVLFFDDSFQVRDRHTGAILVTGYRKDGVYLWPTTSTSPLSSPHLLARKPRFPTLSLLGSSSSLLSLWHSRFGHPSVKVFRN